MRALQTKQTASYTWPTNNIVTRADNLMKLQSGTNVDSRLTLGSEATSAIAQDNSSTPLFTLPPEIRNKIYELVCGGRFLHVEACWANNELKFTYEVCHAGLSEKAAEDVFNAESTAQWFVGAIETRHVGCTAIKDDSESISTTFLTTCRQVYNEAQHIPYSTNTFGFSNKSTLDELTNYLKKSGSGHHLEIRRIHLDIMVRNFDDEQRWKSAITCYLIPRFPEVHQISINLDQWYRAGVIIGCRTPAELEAHQPSGNLRNYLMSALLELRKLPLSRATFVISDAKIFYERSPNTDAELRQSRWTLAEKQAWAHYVKDSILR